MTDHLSDEQINRLVDLDDLAAELGVDLSDEPLSCTPRSLPARLHTQAAAHATDVNPVNAPLADVPLPPERIALLTSKYWGPVTRRLTVQFLEPTTYAMRLLVLRNMNAWHTGGCSIRFTYTTSTGDVRITTAPDGYWSYLGTDIHLIPTNEPTMCLEAFTARTPESEYHRVVRHETGHTLGFVHEHMRKELVAQIDPQRAYAYFARYDGWDRQTVDAQVLTPLDDRTIMATPPDQTSIMCYQLPGSITKTSRPITGGTDINTTDQAFANKVYPR